METLDGVVGGELDENDVRLLIDHVRLHVLQPPAGLLTGFGAVVKSDEVTVRGRESFLNLGDVCAVHSCEAGSKKTIFCGLPASNF